MIDPKKPVKKYSPTAKEKKNLKDATQMKNMRPVFKSGGDIKKAQFGSLIKKGVKKVVGEAKAIKSGVKEGVKEYKATKFTNKLKNWKEGDKIPKMPNGMGFKTGGKVSKAKNGTSLGMKSVKAGYDKNPGVTRADIITAAKGKAKSGASMTKCKYGCK
jgi:hypothetical protein